MDLIEALRQRKSELMDRIADAARRGESDVVLLASADLERAASFIRRYEHVADEISLFLNSPTIQDREAGKLEERNSKVSCDIQAGSPDEIESGRAYGKKVRNAFLEKLSRLHGIHLRQGKGVVYRTGSGRRVGIAVATERQPNRWFLGLPIGGFDDAVLLCDRGKETAAEIFLSRSFLEEHALSRSKDQIKFNIARRGSTFVVQVPGMDDVNVPDSMNYSVLS